MFLVLVIVFLIQLFIAFLRRDGFQKFRLSLVKAAVVFAFLVFLSTETLSFFATLNTAAVALWWLSANVFLCGFLFYAIDDSPREFFAALGNSLQARSAWTERAIDKFYFSSIAFIYSIVLIIALVAPPNTVDSMTYHLARVANWAQNGSVAFYPTQVLRQLYNPPLAEYSILHLQLLTGGDRFANLAQFFSFALCGVAASLIAEELGQNKRTQLLAAFLTATVPMAILQGSSTQTDLVVSFFVAAFFYFFSKAARSQSPEDFVFAALSLGLALLSKGTAYFFCFPIGVVLAAKHLFKSRQSNARKLKFVWRVCAVVLFAFALNVPHFARSWNLFGAPLSSGEERLTNERITAPIVFSNVVRNYALHLGTSLRTLAILTEDAVEFLLGAQVNDPNSTISGQSFSVPLAEHEDIAGNTIHLILLTAAAVFAFFIRRCRREKENAAVLSVSVVAGFLIFCALMKWQPWASRLQSPLFILGCPLIASMLARLDARLRYALATLCLVACLPALFCGEPRALIAGDRPSIFDVPRSGQYFLNTPSIAQSYAEAADFIKKTGAREIGLDLSTDYKNYNFGDWEYPLWILTKDESGAEPYFVHVNLKNVSKKLSGNRPPPEWVISTNAENDIDGVLYEEVWAKPPVRILRAPAAAENSK